MVELREKALDPSSGGGRLPILEARFPPTPRPRPPAVPRGGAPYPPTGPGPLCPLASWACFSSEEVLPASLPGVALRFPLPRAPRFHYL